MIEHKPTFCRICEPLCGMIATVDDGRLISLRPDKDHPLSSGFACQKGIAFTEVGEARTEWEIIAELAERMAGRAPIFAVMGLGKKLAGLVGRRFTPRPFVDAMIRMSEGGNRFGLRRGGLTFRRLIQRHPHGVVVAPHLRTEVLDEVVAYRDGRVRLDHQDTSFLGRLTRLS